MLVLRQRIFAKIPGYITQFFKEYGEGGTKKISKTGRDKISAFMKGSNIEYRRSGTNGAGYYKRMDNNTWRLATSEDFSSLKPGKDWEYKAPKPKGKTKGKTKEEYFEEFEEKQKADAEKEAAKKAKEEEAEAQNSLGLFDGEDSGLGKAVLVGGGSLGAGLMGFGMYNRRKKKSR